jgi:protein-tyrosine phosphatase
MMRAICLGLMSAALLCGAARPSDSVVSAEATPVAEGMRLRWQTERPGHAVDIYLAEQPGASPRKTRRIVNDDRSGEAIVPAPAGRRPYYFIKVDGGHGLWVAQRVLPLEGAVNFRDIGGYPAAGGRRVRWGMVYRSADLTGITPADLAYLGGLDVRLICDLRSTAERSEEAVLRAKLGKIRHWSRDHAISLGDLPRLVKSGVVTRADTRRTMMEIYPTLPYEQASSYREIFKRIAAGDVPLTFNCAGGKDRTGVGAALLLSLLGVSPADIIEDYALSEKIVGNRPRARADEKLSPLLKLPAEVLEPLLASDPAYIRAMFHAVESKNGSVEAYARNVLGLSKREIAEIRRRLLEPARL